MDITRIEVGTKAGLVAFYLLFVMELNTRCVLFAGRTPHPEEPFEVATPLRVITSDFVSGGPV